VFFICILHYQLDGSRFRHGPKVIGTFTSGVDWWTLNYVRQRSEWCSFDVSNASQEVPIMLDHATSPKSVVCCYG